MPASSKAIGIDLGTTHSCVAVWRDSSVTVIPNDQGNRTTPSCVSFSEHNILIGDAAASQAARNPLNTVFNIKRLIGRKFDDPEVQAVIKQFPFRICNKRGKPYIKVKYRGEEKELSPEEISAMILRKMKETAESHLGTKVTHACISIPFHFSRSQRQATIDAATISGMETLQLIAEPSAVAMAYCLYQKMTDQCNVLLFNLGGGTLDVSLVTIDEGVVEIKAAASDNHLGGEDFDSCLVRHFVQQFARTHKKDLSSNPRALRRLRTACERAKRTLSSATQTSIEIDSLFQSIDFYTSLTRSHFELLCTDLFDSILAPVEKVLRDSKIDKENVDDIVMVGGSTRIPQVVEVVSNFFNGKEPKKSINPDEAVARGVAIKAAMLSGDTSETTQAILLLDVAPLPLGIETSGGVMNVIKRNATIPTTKSVQFSTSFNNQTEFFIRVYEGERAQMRDNTLLGEFKISGIPPAPRGIPQIEITFDIDANSDLRVSATEKKSGKSNTLRITDSSLSKEEIGRMIHDAKRYKAENDDCFAIRNRLESQLLNIRNSLTGDLPSNEFRHANKAKLKKYVLEIIHWLDDSPTATKEEYEEKQKELDVIVKYEKRR